MVDFRFGKKEEAGNGDKDIGVNLEIWHLGSTFDFYYLCYSFFKIFCEFNISLTGVG
jgi:hypothetical protein